MTNIQPQTRSLNGGPWRQLEEYGRELARAGFVVQVIAGGLFENETLLPSGVAVPSAQFKILVILRPGETALDVTEDSEVIAVVMPNSHDADEHPWTHYLVSVDAIEQASGYNFLAALPDPVENYLESRVAWAPALPRPSAGPAI